MKIEPTFISKDSSGRTLYHYNCADCGADIVVYNYKSTTSTHMKKMNGIIRCMACSKKHMSQTLQNKTPEEKKAITEKIERSKAKKKEQLINEIGLEEYNRRQKEIEKLKQEKRWETLEERYGSVENALSIFAERGKKTLKERYGVESVQDIPGVREKTARTNLERYGASNPCQNKEVREKIKQTHRNKTGEEQAKILQKRIQTNFKKYGVEFAQQAESTKEVFRQRCLEKFGVDNPSKLSETRVKAHNTIIERYGSWRAIKTDEQRRLKREELIKENMEKYKNINFSVKGFEYFTIDDRPYVKCNNCGFEFLLETPPSQIMTNLHCPHCNPKIRGSQTEKDISNIIKSWGVEVKENSRKILPNSKELDIYLPEYKLAIEYDGSFWHKYVEEENFLKGKDYIGHNDKNYHLKKTNECLEKGIRLIHIFDDEYMNRRDVVFSLLKKFVNKIDKIGARKCKIKEINKETYKKFTDENHLQGFSPASVMIGLFFKEDLVAVIGLGKPRFNKSYEWEIIRYCERQDVVILGGEAKLLEFFKRKYNPKSIISYSDRRWFTGSNLIKCGFSFKESTSPNYKYFKPGYYDFMGRYNFQKYKLKNMKNFEYHEELSEIENMKLNGYSLIYDCGMNVYEWGKDA